MELFLIIALAWLWVWGGLYIVVSYTSSVNDATWYKMLFVLIAWPVATPVKTVGDIIDGWLNG